MTRRIISIILLFLFIGIPASAQMMTDNQLIQYLKKEKEKGTEEQTIVRNVMQRGVTVEQLRRVRKKLEAEQKQLGAIETKTENTNTRVRTQRQVNEDERQKQNSYMIRSQREQDEFRYLDRDKRMGIYEDELEFMDYDSLQYYYNQLPREQQVFGRNIFNQPFLSFEPNQNMATPPNYRLGAGDKVIIDVWGASQETFEETVSPDGTVTIIGVGPIKLGGLSVSQATARLRSKLGQYYSDCQVSLSLGENRSIQVIVLGEVVKPGTYTLSSLSSAFNALYAAGGISDIGTLRNIKVYRQGRCISTIDVYDYLLNGNSSGDVRLQDNDVINVGPYDCLVEVHGKVKRPMFYEMKNTESLGQLIRFAGGFAGHAYTNNIRVVRKNGGQEYSIHTVEEFDMNAFNMADGDSVTVDSVMPRYANMVEVRGAVKHPGQFQMDGNIKSVRDLLRVAEGLREDAFTERAVMHREKEDLTLEMLSLDLVGILNGTSADVMLKKGDVLFVPSKVEMQGEQTLRINGEVNYPGEYQYADNTTVKDLILMAGGLKRGASTAKVDVFRRIYQVDAKESTTKLADHYQFNISNGFFVEDTTFALEPFDIVQVRKSPTYQQQQNVTITGAVNFEGEYAMTDKEFRLSELIQMCGGLSTSAYSKGARLIREMTPDERQQRSNMLKAAQISLYEQSMDSERKFNLERADSLLEMKMDLGNTYNVAINLDEALANPGSASDIVLRDKDQLIVPQYNGTVKISGEVMYPISINYKKGAGLSYYIKRAGGYNQTAGKKNTYAMYMNGAVEQLGRHAGSKSIEPGCEIVVPTKKKRDGLSTAEIMILGTSTVSISSMIISLINSMK